MFKRSLITAVLIATALAANGTTPVAALSFVTQELRPIPSVPSTVDMSAVPGDSGEEFKEEFHQTYPLSPTGRVGLENINGGVQIKVWDRAAVQVDAIKKAYRKERLADAQIEVNAAEDNIHIKTEYPNWNNNKYGRHDRWDNPASVEYTLTIPRKAVLESVELVNGSVDIEGAEGSVKASSINGHVSARGLMGDVKLSTINGALNATFVSLGDTQPISLSSVNGSVTLIIPSDANAAIRAGTVHGGISNDFGLKVKHGEYVGQNLDGQIGTGGPRIKLGNVNGAIVINHAQDGKPLSPATSLAADIDKDKDKDKEKEKEKDKDESKQAIEVDIAREVNAAVAAAEVDRINTAKITREAQRQVEQALQEAQREIERAQREVQRETERSQSEVQRETERQIREQVRASNAGRGRGVGSGDDRATAQESKTFTVTGSPSVNLSTFDGGVTVHGWDRSEVKYNITKRSVDDESLRQIGVQADQQGSAVSVIARSDSNNNGSADLEVWVPRKSSLHVSSDDGGLKVDGVTGNITLRTGDGGIDVTDSAGQLQLNTGDGHITVFKFDGELDARTGDGSIRLDGSFNALSARTGDGAISLTVPSNSNFTVETNAYGDVTNEGLTLSEDMAPSKRVRRWRVGNGGKVFVLNTGDGQIVLRSR
jgi:DUF4097 and DUF4098 domain-containing protein YvlB